MLKLWSVIGTVLALTSCSAARSAEVGPTALTMKVSASDSLCAVSLENHLAHRTLNLGGAPEIQVIVDPSRRDIGITGWKFAVTQRLDGRAEEDRGLISGAASAQFDDSSWSRVMTPNCPDAPLAGYAWARRGIKLEEEDRGQPVSFSLGGFGLFDYGRMRVFLNGQLIGARDESRPLLEPLRITIRPDSPEYKALRFGAENLLALQLSKYNDTLARLNEVDFDERFELSRFYWPPTFEQRITIGEPPRLLKLKVLKTQRKTAGAAQSLEVLLENEESHLGAQVTYAWESGGTVLHKFVRLNNANKQPVRLLDVELGRYSTGVTTTNGEQGHPVFADGCFFLAWHILPDGPWRKEERSICISTPESD
jgi:hypothetical protein